MINIWTGIGRLTKNPDIRQVGDSTVANFTLAVDNPYRKDDNGNTLADFIPVVVWGKTAEFVQKYFTKGLRVAVSGRLQSRSWDDPQGNKHFVIEVNANTVEFADGKKDNNTNKNNNNETFLDDDSEDLPF